ncbi:hypothetical protein [Paracoccus sp. DMF]|uniref:hypothetical protein n=1 Tax=Paracoccus sp. DMF TaxID=400837 RepID=UPI001100052A|nr:hypothetical protein [Paracoccus sp. DMF]MCV2447967.1 hypothetical protein [Paracoccus sp. DMF]
MLQRQVGVRTSNELILQFDEAPDDQRDQKIQAQLAVGHARTEVQELRLLSDIQNTVIAALNRCDP